MKIKITLPDQSVREYEDLITPKQIATDISPRLAESAVIAEVNGKLVDMLFPIKSDAAVKIHTFSSTEGREVYWHSTSHLMAQAVKTLFPNVKVTIGPAIENGFYYDFDRNESFTDEELLKIEDKMQELAQQNIPYVRKEISRNEGIKLFQDLDEPYKVEILQEIPEGETLTIYTNGNFTDLCRGPHIESTGKVKSFKLLKTSGAYWRGDERNKMLKRIYGISFPTSKELKQYLMDLEEAKKRDHRKIGKELDLFSISDDIGGGLILWHPNGSLMRDIIEQYWKKRHWESGYKLVTSPHIGKAELWKTSGHLGFYKEGMFAPIEVEGQEYYLKPMNCPFHIMIYKNTMHSYRELPLRYAELGTVYRYERSGTLHGLMRVRGFTQDDAHIICTPDQIMEEVERLLIFSMEMLQKFGFKDFQIFLSTMPEGAVGDPADWKLAEESLRKALEKQHFEFDVDEGGGAFYGPKIDIKIKDALKRSWQCTTIQFDFNEPMRFEMEYIGADNQPHRPLMVHRAIFGSMERFFGTLIEYYAGNFPVWLCPVQVMVIPVGENFEVYAREIQAQLLKKQIRTEIDLASEKIGYKIRDAEMKKIPYMLIVGQKEAESNSVSVRRHTHGDMGMIQVEEAIKMIKDEIESSE
jgi:threonyl-tRNA synthetase